MNMAVSRNSGHDSNGTDIETFVGQWSRYDLVLAAIPIVLSTGILVGVLTSVPFYLPVALSALAGASLIVDVIYLHPPTATRSELSYSESE